MRPAKTTHVAAVSSTLSISTNPAWLATIRGGYGSDNWSQRLLDTLWDSVVKADCSAAVQKLSAPDALEAEHLDGRSALGITVCSGLLYVGNHLCIPRVDDVREQLFCLAHNVLGHFGTDKSYASLRTSYY